MIVSATPHRNTLLNEVVYWNFDWFNSIQFKLCLILKRTGNPGQKSLDLRKFLSLQYHKEAGSRGTDSTSTLPGPVHLAYTLLQTRLTARLRLREFQSEFSTFASNSGKCSDEAAWHVPVCSVRWVVSMHVLRPVVRCAAIVLDREIEFSCRKMAPKSEFFVSISATHQ